MRQYIDTLQDVQGNALVGATVLVQNYIGAGNASIFSDNGLTPIANSTVTTGADGQFSFFAADGDYNLVMSKNSTVFKTQSPVSLFDGTPQVTYSDTGAVNAYAITNTALEKALRTGLRASFLAANSNTGASTFQYNGLAAKNIVFPGGTAMTTGTIVAGGIYPVEYDGTNWQLRNATSAFTLFYAQTAGEIAAGVTPSNYTYPPGHAWRYLSNAQVADAIAYTYLVDSTTALQNWLNASYKTNIDAYLPGGGYLISGTLIINNVDQTNYRNKGFRVYGNGAGPVFVTPGTTGVGTTVIQSNTNAFLMRYQQYLGTVTTSGNYYVEYIRFQQVNAAATVSVVQLDVLGEYSAFRHCEIWQAGTGDGLRCLELTKGTIENCNILNRDWNTNALGAARVGAGIDIFSQYNAGLGCIRKCTSRGFKDAYVLGDGSNDLSAMLFQDNEASVVFRGVTINTLMSKCLVTHNYFEGVEGTCIIDKGRYTVVRDNIIQTATYSVGIDASANGGGCTYDSNEVGLPAGQSGVTGITVAGSATLINTVTNNSIIWGSSGTGLSNVIGLQLSGANAMIKHSGNMFNPNAGWAGAANCHEFLDSTTSLSGSSGSGVIGFGINTDSTTGFPVMKRGALGYWKNATPLGNAALAANVLTLGTATYVVWNPSSGTLTVNSINAAVVEEGHEYILRVVNGTGNSITFTTGANLRIGTANIVQLNGTTWTYRLFMDTNTAWIESAIQNS